MGKKIVVKSLSTKEINKAIKSIERYKKQLEDRTRSLVEELTRRGENIAKVNVVQLGAFDSGVLESSIQGYYSPLLGCGIIKTNCYYAVYVEFGTGARGAEASHPMAGEKGYTYDINGHGEDGWYYYNTDTGKQGWTTGMPSRPFMYDTAMELRKEVYKIAKSQLRVR